MPRAYWLNPLEVPLSSQILVVQPSTFEYSRIVKNTASATSKDFDMDILNTLYRSSALVLPHRTYDLLTGTLRGDNFTTYLGSEEEKWDPDKAIKEAKLIHFSDWPIPKVSVSYI